MTLPFEPPRSVPDPGRPPAREFTAEELRSGCIELDELRLLSRFSIPQTYVEQTKVSYDERETIRSFGERYVFQMHTSLWAHLDERIVAYRRWPKTWWDAFKARWFPLWLLRRFPAEFDEFSINRPVYKAAYVNVVTPDRDKTWLYVERAPAKTTTL